MNAKGLLSFIVLVFGSLYFGAHFLSTTQTRGSGDDHILIAWSIRRGVVALGLYVLFLAVVFGAYFFLKRETSPGQSNESADGDQTASPPEGLASQATRQ